MLMDLPQQYDQGIKNTKAYNMEIGGFCSTTKWLTIYTYVHEPRTFQIQCDSLHHQRGEMDGKINHLVNRSP